MEVNTNNIYRIATTAVEKELSSNFSQGLSTTEVIRRQKEFGKNILVVQKKRGWVKILLEQFTNPLIFVLLGAAILSFVFQEQLEAIAILIVICINTSIGFFMELQANRSMEALQKLSKHPSVVLRDGEVQSVDATEIVVGDIIILEAGNIVPADARIIVQHNLGVNESALTGESNQVSKSIEAPLETTVLTDRKNSLFKGTIISRGNSKAVVTHIGKNTELGKIATLVQDATQNDTPLEQKLNALGKNLVGLTLVLAVLVVVAGIIEGRDIYLMIKTAIALSIAAIPEGLPVVATIALARGMLRLSRQQVIIKKLSAVETLGEVQIIFTDKTGTLTENKLHVNTLLFSFGKFNIDSNFKIKPLSTLHHLDKIPVFEKLLLTAVLCNNANLGSPKKDAVEETVQAGDPLEIALLEFGKSKGFYKKSLQKKYPRIKEIPFDASTKMMGTLHEMPDGKYLVCIKGALEVLLQKSDKFIAEKEEKNLNNPAFWRKENNQIAAKGERTLSFAYKIIEQPEEDFFHHLTFIGCISFLDPPRPDIKAAMDTCHTAGIKVIMVTGDHPETAKNIAQQVNLTQDEAPIVLHGKAIQDIHNLNAYETNNLLKTTVFARVSPTQKLNLIEFYQDRKYIVGMTGDGVNDAPALKKADIGIAMGQRGTDAAKEAAELILEDDSFQSVVVAIHQGRGIFTNIRHFVVYLLSCNLSEILAIVVASFFTWGSLLTPLQLLFLNMVTDVFPALALGMGKSPKNVMSQPPRKSNEPFITKQHWKAILIYATVMSSSILGMNYWATHYLMLEDKMVNSLVFYTLILVQLLHVFDLPSRSISFYNNEITRNKYIWGAIIICILIPFLLYQFDAIKIVLNLNNLNMEQAVGVLVFSIIPIIVIQFLKRVKVIL